MKKLNLSFTLCLFTFTTLTLSLSFSADWTPPADTFLQAGYYNFDTVTINAGITITCKGNTALNTGVVITCYNLTVNSSGKISADTQGYLASQGPGTPPGQNSGGSYGGYGGYRAEGGLGAVYGSIRNPIDLGSGGYLFNGTGNGGGCVIFIVSNELKVNGSISADGQGGGGAGSGGSIKINTKILSGSGSITTNGGTAAGTVSNGGGGRIAIYYEQNNFTGTILARRGTDFFATNINGGCGTIYMKSLSQPSGDLILDGGGYGYPSDSYVIRDNYTPILTTETFDTVIVKDSGTFEILSGNSLTISNIYSNNKNNVIRYSGEGFIVGANTIPNGDFTFDSYTLEINKSNLVVNNMTIKGNGKLTHIGPYYSETQTINVLNLQANNLTVESNGLIDAVGKGYMYNKGPGTPPGSFSGGSYGGYGGKRAEGGLGAVYGSIRNPADLGSGGYLYQGTGNGGGCIIISVSNELKVNGSISADGQGGAGGGGGAGAGSGGSIKINTKILSGSGSITTKGGTAAGTVSNGGGGRVAIYYEQNTFTGTILARRGTDFTATNTNGGCGTIYMKSSSQSNGDLIIDGAGYTSDVYTPILTTETFDTIIIKDSQQIEILSGNSLTTSNIYSNNRNNVIRYSGEGFSVGANVIPNGDFTFDSYTLEINKSNLIMNNMTIRGNGRLTYKGGPYTDTEYILGQINKLSLEVRKNLTIDYGGSIDVTGKGYLTGPGKYKSADGGGAYGGRGGIYNLSDTRSETYGSYSAPTDLGSGGSGDNGGPLDGGKRGGGGAVYLLVIEKLTVNGSILSEGGYANGYAAGSGGSIYIKASYFEGVSLGKISVKGGNASTRAGGGGGRLAIYYYVNNYLGAFDTSPGSGGVIPADSGTQYMQYTTFYLPPRAPSIESPSYTSPITGKRPAFKWTAPTDLENDTLNFEIEITQDSSFASTPVISASSDVSLSGFNYSADNGLTWLSYPSTGISSSANPALKAGYTAQSDLWIGNWYWRVRAKDRDGNGDWSEKGFLPSIIGSLFVKITSPDADSSVIYLDKIKVEGTIEQSITQTISINNVSQNLTLTDNKFSYEVNLEIGKNTIVATGNGVLGDYISDTVEIYRLKLPVSVIEEKIGADGGTIRLDDRDEDKENDTRIEIEPGTLDREVRVTLKTLDGDTPIYGNIPSYEIFVDGREQYRFKKKIKIILSYRNLNVKETEEDKLRIFHWDGVKWQLVGGEINKTKKVVSTYTNHVSRYAVMVLPSSKEIVVNVTPPIFTPNADGVNDMVVFNCYSSNSAKLEIRIYDSAGRNVRDIREEVTGSGISLAWDGLDANNNLVETGIYLYNVIISGKVASSGTVIIAK